MVTAPVPFRDAIVVNPVTANVELKVPVAPAKAPPIVISSNQPLSHLTLVEPKLSVLSVSLIISPPEVIPPVATCVAVVVNTPVTRAVVAILTAPSISTISRLAVPSTSTSPEISKLVNTEVPAAVTIPVVVRFSLPKLIAPELSVIDPPPIVNVPDVKVSNQPFNQRTLVEPKLSVLSVSLIILEPVVMPAVVVKAPVIVVAGVIVTVELISKAVVSVPACIVFKTHLPSSVPPVTSTISV